MDFFFLFFFFPCITAWYAFSTSNFCSSYPTIFTNSHPTSFMCRYSMSNAALPCLSHTFSWSRCCLCGLEFELEFIHSLIHSFDRQAFSWNLLLPSYCIGHEGRENKKEILQQLCISSKLIAVFHRLWPYFFVAREKQLKHSLQVVIFWREFGNHLLTFSSLGFSSLESQLPPSKKDLIPVFDHWLPRIVFQWALEVGHDLSNTQDKDLNQMWTFPHTLCLNSTFTFYFLIIN